MKKQIYLIDLAHESKLGLSSDSMPLQLGLIGAYCLKEHSDKVDVKIFKFIDEFVVAVNKQPPFIVAASNYLWNIDLGYKFASAIKKQFPEVITVFGGPNYPDDPQEQADWLRQYPNIDFYIYKDGEAPFSLLVGLLLKNPDVDAAKEAKLPSCHAFLNNEPYFGETEPRLKNLDAIPSPYTTGLMDKFFEQHLLPTIQTNRGCPFSCTYCAEGGEYYTNVCKTSLERKKTEVDYIVKRVKHTKTLRITDSNFGMFPEDVEFCEYLGKIQKETGYPDYLACSTGKNQKERILKCNALLNNIMRFTASVQSLDPEVLKNIKRTNISFEEMISLSDQISDTDTHSYSEIILALPGDSIQAEKKSFEGLMSVGISNITQHQLALIYGAEAASRKSREKYNINGMFRPIQRSVGQHSFNKERFFAIDVEEICVSTNTLSFQDYLEARRLYLTVGLFYNDRIFGEIHALLRLLRLSTWDWIQLIHDDIKNTAPVIKALYQNFTDDTKNELWKDKAKLIEDVSANVNKYTSGEIGGNLIYKYRSQALIVYFPQLQATAFDYLRKHLKQKNVECEEAVKEIEKFSQYRKSDLLNLDFETEETFNYDLIRMIQDAKMARAGVSLNDIRHPTRIRIAHTKQQKESIKRQLDFYGNDLGGITLLMSRFPIKRFYRFAEKISAENK